MAIDRATRLSLLWVYESKDKKAATDFLTRCLAFYPFKITKILTDNGREFTLNGFKNRYGTKVAAAHEFDQVCQDEQIEHRTTLPYTPKTNGMVERMNGLTKENTTKTKRYSAAQEMYDDLHGWFVRYNFCRPHRRIGKRRRMRRLCTGLPKTRLCLPGSLPSFSVTETPVHNLVKLDTYGIVDLSFRLCKS